MFHLSQSGGFPGEILRLKDPDRKRTFCVNESDFFGYRKGGRIPIDDGDRMGAPLSEGGRI